MTGEQKPGSASKPPKRHRPWVTALLFVLATFIPLLFFPQFWGLVLIPLPRLLPSITPWRDSPFLAKLIVDLEANGQPVRIERILECKIFGEGRGEYAPTVGALGTRLPDGGAVMMWTPYYCGTLTVKPEEGRFHAYSDKFIPLMAWMPNADRPEPLEIYFSRTYFDQPNPRVRFKGIKVEPPPKGAKADPPGEFEWFTQKIFHEERDKRDSRGGPLRGFGSYALQESQWRGYHPELDSLLDGMTEPGAVPQVHLPQANLRADAAAMLIVDRVLGMKGRSMPEQFRSDHTTRTTADLADRWPLDVQSKLGEFRPTDLRDGRLELTDDHGRGYAILRHYADVPKITLRDIPIDLKKTSYLFDPETKTLIYVDLKFIVRKSLKPAR